MDVLAQLRQKLGATPSGAHAADWIAWTREFLVGPRGIERAEYLQVVTEFMVSKVENEDRWDLSPDWAERSRTWPLHYLAALAADHVWWADKLKISHLDVIHGLTERGYRCAADLYIAMGSVTRDSETERLMVGRAAAECCSACRVFMAGMSAMLLEVGGVTAGDLLALIAGAGDADQASER